MTSPLFATPDPRPPWERDRLRPWHYLVISRDYDLDDDWNETNVQHWVSDYQDELATPPSDATSDGDGLWDKHPATAGLPTEGEVIMAIRMFNGEVMTDPRQYQATKVAVTTPDSVVTHEAEGMNVDLETGSLRVTVGDTPVAVYAPGQWCSAVRK